MKNDWIIKFLCCLFMVTQIIGCSNWIEAEPTILPEMKYKELTPEEEAALIAYKNSKHKIFFAWMNYSPATSSMQTRLRGIPDSLDIVSFFTGYVNNKQNREDVKFLQERRGTKVLLTMWPEDYFTFGAKGENDLDSMIVYAENLVDSIFSWGLDGFDLDYEPNFGGESYTQEMMRTFIGVMSKYMGPKCDEQFKVNGKHKLLVVDGQWLDAEYADRFDYFIGQAYNSSADYELNDRCEGGIKDYGIGFPNEKRIMCEWVSMVGNPFGQGGVPYKYKDEYIPSLWGMAHYAAESPNNVAGCGAYVLQFGYAEGNHLNLPVPPNNYYYARQAIQIMNPANKRDEGGKDNTLEVEE